MSVKRSDEVGERKTIGSSRDCRRFASSPLLDLYALLLLLVRLLLLLLSRDCGKGFDVGSVARMYRSFCSH